MFRKISYFLTVLCIQFTFLFFSHALAFAHHFSNQGETRQADAEQNNASSTAEYTVTFNATWSAQTHPTDDFPTSNAHFSGLVGAMHNDNVTFWAEGQVATVGIELMAEKGSKAELLTEIDAAIAAGFADLQLSGGGIGLSPGAVSIGPFTVNQSHPKMSLVSMIAPSPDWFVGVNGLSLLDANGEWIDNLVAELYPYDSGTDDGAEYRSGNVDSVPREAIANFTGVAPFSEQPIGTFTISRILQPSIEILTPIRNVTIHEEDEIMLTYRLADLPSDADHLHLYVDGVLQAPHYNFSAPILVSGLSVGTHEILLDASKEDHTPLGITDTIRVTVVPTGKAIVPPSDGEIFLPMVMR